MTRFVYSALIPRHKADYGKHAGKLLFFFAIAVVSSISYASDWPQFLGPTRNGLYAGGDLIDEWPKDGPPRTWQTSVGQGFSGPVVSSRKLFIFHRVDNKETVDCLEALTGKVQWTFRYPTAYRDDFGFDEGPRSTPAINGGRIYTYGAEGALHCLDCSTGKKLWNVDTKTEFHPAKGFFGMACSPLIEGNSVILNVGSRSEAGIVAFDKDTGKVLWKATRDEASYSSPVATTTENRRYALVLTRSALIGLEPISGKIVFQYPFLPPISSSVSAATPLALGNRVFLSASYGTGALLLKIPSTEKIWKSDDALSAHYATPVHHNGFLYGIHGRADPGFEPPASLRCIELETGKLMWERTPFEAATITLAGDQLFILTERGELIRAAASPEGYKENGRSQILPNQVRAHPALADGHFYARSKDKLICIDLRKQRN